MRQGVNTGDPCCWRQLLLQPPLASAQLPTPWRTRAHPARTVPAIGITFPSLSPRLPREAGRWESVHWHAGGPLWATQETEVCQCLPAQPLPTQRPGSAGTPCRPLPARTPPPSLEAALWLPRLSAQYQRMQVFTCGLAPASTWHCQPLGTRLPWWLKPVERRVRTRLLVGLKSHFRGASSAGLGL